MKTILRTTTAVMGLLLVTSPAAFCFAQVKPMTPVVVVDIGYIFKNHARFTQMMERMKQEVKASDEQFRARGKDIETRVKQLESYKPDSAEFKRLEAKTARRHAQIQADMTIKRKEFLWKEGEVYYAIYQEIQKEVKAFADNHGIGLVLLFRADEIDSSNRASVLQGVSRPVVYQRNLNITHDILDRLQRAGDSQRTARAPTRGVTSRTQPGTSGAGTSPDRSRTLPRR